MDARVDGPKFFIIESPYAGNVEKNVAFAQACMRDCFERGETPFASHLLYTQPGILDDALAHERLKGMAAGWAWAKAAKAATAVYYDLGISDGMKEGVARALADNRAVHYRLLPRHRPGLQWGAGGQSSKARAYG